MAFRKLGPPAGQLGNYTIFYIFGLHMFLLLLFKHISDLTLKGYIKDNDLLVIVFFELGEIIQGKGDLPNYSWQ